MDIFRIYWNIYGLKSYIVYSAAMKQSPDIDYTDYEISAYRYVAPTMGYMHSHAQMEFNLLERGHAVYIINGDYLEVPADRFFVFWGVSPHHLIDISSDCILHVVHFPIGLFLEFPMISQIKKQILNNAVVFSEESSERNGDIRLFERWESLPLADETAKLSLSLELQARVTREEFRQKCGISAPVTVPQPPQSFIKVSKMIQFMHKHYGERLAVDDIAQSAGLQANYAIRLFKKLHGCGLIQYLTEIRLNATQRELILTDEKVINIALDCGFNTLSRFYDAFAKRNGCSPAKYRSDHQTH